MKILDRYIVKKFVFILVFASVAFVSIFIIIDLVERLSDYIDRDVPAIIIVSYYFYFVPYIIVLMLPIAILLASMFSIGELSKYGELTAMKASGLSINRILLPIFIFSLMISFVMVAFSETVVPDANQRRAEIKDQYIEGLPKRLATRVSNLYLQEHLDSVVSNRESDMHSSQSRYSRRLFVGHYQSDSKVGKKISIQEYKDVFIINRIDAKSMRWTGHYWEAINAYKRTFKGQKEIAVQFDTLALHQLSFTPDILTKVKKKPEEMSYNELQNYIDAVANNGGDPKRWFVDLYLKISFPFSNFIIVLFGAPLAAGKVRSGGAVGVALTLAIAFFYFGAVKIGQSFGQNNTIDPLLAAWLGNIVFFISGIGILIKTKS